MHVRLRFRSLISDRCAFAHLEHIILNTSFRTARKWRASSVVSVRYGAPIVERPAEPRSQRHTVLSLAAGCPRTRAVALATRAGPRAPRFAHSLSTRELSIAAEPALAGSHLIHHNHGYCFAGACIRRELHPVNFNISMSQRVGAESATPPRAGKQPRSGRPPIRQDGSLHVTLTTARETITWRRAYGRGSLCRGALKFRSANVIGKTRRGGRNRRPGRPR